jgi:hypothetical protein
VRISFASALRVEKLDATRWLLLEPFLVDVWEWEPLDAEYPGMEPAIGGYNVTVPKGFLTDFASVPRLPFAYWFTGGLGDRAAVLHDYLYALKVPRAWADAAFHAALKADNVSGWRRALMYAGVRLGGGSHYDERAELVVPQGPPL